MKSYRTPVIIISLILIFLAGVMPPFLGMNRIGTTTVSIFVGTLLLLLLVDYTWPVFLCMFAFAFHGIYTLNDSIRICLGNNIFWFMMVNGMVFVAMEKSGLFRRIAIWIASRPFTRKNPWLFLYFYFIANIITGSIMNTTAVCLLFFAITADVMEQLGCPKGSREGAAMMLLTMVASNISHAISPFGHSITVMSMTYFEEYSRLNIFSYTVFGYLTMAVGALFMVLIAKYVLRFNGHIFADYDLQSLRNGEQKMSPAEKLCAGILVWLIAFWISPTIIQRFSPAAYKFVNSSLGIIAPVLAAIPVLCIVTFDDGKPLMDIRESIQKAPWSAGLTVAVSMFFGTVLQNEEAGIIPALSEAISPFCSKLPAFAFVVVITLIVMIMSNFTSCTLSVMLGCIIALSLVEGNVVTGMNLSGFVFAITVAAQSAFATPPASGPAAICAGQGWVKSGEQFTRGMLFGLVWWAVGILGYLLISVIMP